MKTRENPRFLSQDVIGAATAEFIGTLLLIFIPTTVATVAAINSSIAGSPLDSLSVALAFGVTLFVLVRIFAAKSGANFNPAVTLGLLAHDRISTPLAGVYALAQVAGAVCGSLLTHLATIGLPGVAASGYGVTQPANGAGLVNIIVVEFIGTTLLALVIASVALGKQSALDSSLSIGATLGVLVLFGGAITGGAFNPARALGPMITTGKLDLTSLVYIISELAGGVAGITLYLKYFAKVEQPE